MNKIFLWLFCVTALFFAGKAHAGLNDGLVAYYPFNGDATDASGNGNDCTVVNAVLTSDRNGKADSAYAFDGEGDYLDCGNDASLDLTGSITLSLWINPQNLASGRVLRKRAGGDGFEIDIWGNELRFGLNGTVYAFWDLTGLTNTWIFVTAVLDTSLAQYQAKLYVNRNQPNYSSFNEEIGTNTNPLYLGIWEPPNYVPFTGKIDSVRIYNRALSEKEVMQLYGTADNPNSIVPAALTPLLLSQ